MNGTVLEETRAALRHAMLSRRNSIAPADRLLWSGSIQARVFQLPLFHAVRSLALYSPIQNEVDTGVILERALGARKRVFYPRSANDVFEFVEVASALELSVGRFGILEPTGEDCLSESDKDSLLIFVPGLVFDCSGNRLGRGRGWYDRMLGQFDIQCTIIGLAYEFQLVDVVPAAPWDHKVDLLVTERRLIDCGVQPLDPLGSVDS